MTLYTHLPTNRKEKNQQKNPKQIDNQPSQSSQKLQCVYLRKKLQRKVGTARSLTPPGDRPRPHPKDGAPAHYSLLEIAPPRPGGHPAGGRKGHRPQPGFPTAPRVPSLPHRLAGLPPRGIPSAPPSPRRPPRRACPQPGPRQRPLPRAGRSRLHPGGGRRTEPRGGCGAEARPLPLLPPRPAAGGGARRASEDTGARRGERGPVRRLCLNGAARLGCPARGSAAALRGVVVARARLRRRREPPPLAQPARGSSCDAGKSAASAALPRGAPIHFLGTAASCGRAGGAAPAEGAGPGGAGISRRGEEAALRLCGFAQVCARSVSYRNKRNVGVIWLSAVPASAEMK